MRIISGTWRGRRLAAPPGRDTRPTSDRVREALFSIIGPRVVDARVADCFAGTGALGLEALSRGAAHVDFFESGRAARRVLAQNIATLDAGEQATVHGAPLPKALSAGAPWDLVLVDPPWQRDLGPPAVARLVEVGRLAPGALIVVEAARDRVPTSAQWVAAGCAVHDERRYGDTALVFLKAASSE